MNSQRKKSLIIDTIVDQIDEGGPRSYYSFETFVIHLLKHHIQSQKKELLIEDGRANQQFFDAVAPNGFDDFIGSTVIEIRFNIAKFPIRHLIERVIGKLSSKLIEKNIPNLLIISAKPIPTRFKAQFDKEIKILETKINIILWGPEELNKIAYKYRTIVKDIANNLFALRLKSVISNPPSDWKVERESIINELKMIYEKGQFSLFLGAGVSSSAGMPDWNTLLNSLFVTYLTQEFNDDIAINDDDINDLVKRLSSVDEPSALMAARYLRKGLSKNGSDQKEFIETITKNLYQLRNKNYDIDSTLIKSISKMCSPRRTGAKVKSVITYNFDDLLERQLETRNISHRCIYTDIERYHPDELPIYHVHGFLPEKRQKYDSLDKSTLVFSEEGYHQIYSDSYHWSNLVQLNSLRENNCVMVGLSMTDPNLRRLLDISSKKSVESKHYAFMKRLSINDFTHDKNNQVINNIDSAEKFLNMHLSLNQELMKELGVAIIWYDSYNEIPVILQSISEQKN